MTTKNATRPYRSALRAEHTERTRELLLEAVVRRVVADGRFDLSLPVVAREAGVSVPTVYRHFATLDDLLEGVAEHIAHRVGVDTIPEDPAALPQHARALFAACDENEATVRARLLTPQGGEIRKRMGRHRPARLVKATRKAAPALGDEEVQALAGILRVLLSSSCWQMLKDEFDVPGRRSGVAVGWAISTLLRAAKSGSHPLKEE
jgi:AcrR family transcriptional regulator